MNEEEWIEEWEMILDEAEAKMEDKKEHYL